MMDMHEKRVKLQEYLRAPGCTPIMCAYDVLSAKLIERAGFPIVYTGSFITGASQLGMADVGLVQLKDLLPLAREIAKEIDLPIIADVDNGWYHAGNIWRMIHEFEYAGISGIQVEDAILGKHVGGDPIDMPKEVMCDHVRAMAAARTDKDFMIIARTDALWLKNDWEETIDRCNAYLAAGADACFITFPGTIKELKKYRDRIHGPVVTTAIHFEDSIAEETEAGANMSCYWPTTLYAAFSAVRATLQKFKETQDITKIDYDFEEHEIMDLLPYDRYYHDMEAFHGADQYLHK